MTITAACEKTTEPPSSDFQRFGQHSIFNGVWFRTIGAGPHLVLIHGGSGSRTHWWCNVGVLSKSFRVTTVDMPGFGESDAVPEGISSEHYLARAADALSSFIDAQSSRRFHVAAFSFGTAAICGILTRIHARGGLLPERLSLLSPTGLGPPESRTIALEKVPRADGKNAQAITEATARNLGRWMLAQTPLPDSDAVSIHLENVKRSRFDSRQISLANTLYEDLATLSLPLQVLLGARDALAWPSVPEREAQFRERLTGASILTIEQAGHWVQFEAAPAVNAALVSFHIAGRPAP